MRRAAIVALALLTSMLATSELALSLPILGVGPDVLVMMMVAVTMGERPTVAATHGFAIGLVRDLVLSTPVGISAFAYAVTGYVVGLAGVVRGVWAAIALVAGATFTSQVLFGFGTLVLTPSPAMSALPRVAFLATAYNALLTPLLMPVLRRITTPPGSAAAPAGE